MAGRSDRALEGAVTWQSGVPGATARSSVDRLRIVPATHGAADDPADAVFGPDAARFQPDRVARPKPVRVAKVRRDACQHVTESTRDLEPRVAVKEQLSAIGHLAAPFRGARDHGELPAPNCTTMNRLFLVTFGVPGKFTRRAVNGNQLIILPCIQTS